jgi:hypothetical protein
MDNIYFYVTAASFTIVVLVWLIFADTFGELFFLGLQKGRSQKELRKIRRVKRRFPLRRKRAQTIRSSESRYRVSVSDWFGRFTPLTTLFAAD